MKLKLKLLAETRVPATCEFVVECPDEFKTPQAAAAWAGNNLTELLNQADKDYEEKHSAYVRSGYTIKCPDRPYYWSVDDDDVWNNVSNAGVELDEWEEVK